jgi:hypothetical protein
VLCVRKDEFDGRRHRYDSKRHGSAFDFFCDEKLCEESWEGRNSKLARRARSERPRFHVHVYGSAQRSLHVVYWSGNGRVVFRKRPLLDRAIRLRTHQAVRAVVVGNGPHRDSVYSASYVRPAVTGETDRPQQWTFPQARPRMKANDKNFCTGLGNDIPTAPQRVSSQHIGRCIDWTSGQASRPRRNENNIATQRNATPVLLVRW